MQSYAELMAYQRETEALAEVAGRLGWDQETMMPQGAADQRGEEMAAMEKVLHARRSNPAVGAALDGRKAALLANHGAVTVGTDLADAVEASLLLEWACRLYMQAAAVDAPRALTTAQQHAVIDEATRVGYGAKHREDQA